MRRLFDVVDSLPASKAPTAAATHDVDSSKGDGGNNATIPNGPWKYAPG